MKVVYAGVLLNLILVLIFGFIYWININEFSKDITNKEVVAGEIIDCFYMSVTIQAGVGYQGLSPIGNIGKLLLMIQQLCMISSNVLVLYLLYFV
jgi:hypothetical protein